MVQTFYVLSLGDKNNVILGFPWLNKHNPTINWTSRTMKLRGISAPRHNSLEVIKQQYLLHYLGAVERSEPEHVTQLLTELRRKTKLREILGPNHYAVRKMTLSTALAQEAQRAEQKLPPQYAHYTKVFDEPGEVLRGLRNQIS